MFVCKPWMFFTSKVITWKHFFVSEWRFLHSFFLGCRFLHFFSVAIFWFSPEKCRNLHSEWWFLHYFFRLNKFSIFFFSCDFSVFTRRMNFSTFFLVGKFSVLLCSTVNFPVSREEVKKPAFWIDLNFFCSNYISFLHQIRMEQKYHFGDFSVFWLEISSFFDCELFMFSKRIEQSPFWSEV